jgi:heterotetrameric sarcosine oxidase gamma subunit
LSVPQPSRRLETGGLIDRTQPLAFKFDDVSYSGFAGDTLASALLACGVRLIGRSFKYHRPRGILTAGSEEPNALVELRLGSRREPNTRATVVELFDNCQAFSQNRWPSLAFDLGAISSLLSPVFVAGFYYKTFMWPRAWWEKLYEPAIREAAGLGRASNEPDPDRYAKSTLFCDVLVIGGGPAGLAASLVAARSGARVVVCDEDFVLGGRLNADRHEIDGTTGSMWARQVEAELASMPEVRILRRTTVFGTFDGAEARTFGALERVSDHLAEPKPDEPRQRLWRIVAKRTVLASGAVERPPVFGTNDRPGIMMASAVRAYLNRFAVTPGQQVALFTSTDDGWKTAFDLAKAGVKLVAIVDARKDLPASVLSRSKSLDTRTWLGAHVVATRGARGLNQITIREADGRLNRVQADTLAVSGGWNPTISLCTHLGHRPQWSDAVSAFIPAEELLAGLAGHAHGAERSGSRDLRCLLTRPGSVDRTCATLPGASADRRAGPRVRSASQRGHAGRHRTTRIFRSGRNATENMNANSSTVLRPNSPFSGLSMPSLSRPGLTVTDRSALAITRLESRKDGLQTLIARVRERLGIELPTGPRRVEANGLAFVGVGVHAWLVVSDESNSSLQGLVEGLGAMTDQSGSYGLLRLAGPLARDALSKMLPIDLHAQAFTPGAAASTVASHIPVVLWRLDDAPDGTPIFEIAAPRSHSGSLLHVIAESAH